MLAEALRDWPFQLDIDSPDTIERKLAQPLALERSLVYPTIEGSSAHATSLDMFAQSWPVLCHFPSGLSASRRLARLACTFTLANCSAFRFSFATTKKLLNVSVRFVNCRRFANFRVTAFTTVAHLTACRSQSTGKLIRALELFALLQLAPPTASSNLRRAALFGISTRTGPVRWCVLFAQSWFTFCFAGFSRADFWLWLG